MPAVATAALVLLGALQIGWSRPILLPPADAITPLRLPSIALPPLGVPAMARALFAVGPVAATAAVQPLDGARAVGVASRGGRALAFLQTGDGRVVTLAPGQAFAGWQLVGIGRDALRFARGGERTVLPFGTGAPPAATPGEAAR